VVVGLGCGSERGGPARAAGAVDSGIADDRPIVPTSTPSVDAAGDSRAASSDALAVAEDRPQSRPDVVPPPADGGGARDAQRSVGDGGSGPSCAGGERPICLDFEQGNVPPPWTAPVNPNFHIDTARAAHGRYAMHIGNLMTKPSLNLRTTALNGIKDVVWGRFYLYVSPGAPWGHGALVKVYDNAGNSYEVGFESNSFVGLWQASNGREYYTRSRVPIPGDRWVCVEFQYDGATPALQKIWSDGVLVPFPPELTAGTDPIQKYAPPTLVRAGQFSRMQIGVEFFHGSSLVSCPKYPPFECPSYNNDQPPTITDVWIDDIAADNKRVGCP
jgi:hypothetical protein